MELLTRKENKARRNFIHIFPYFKHLYKGSAETTIEAVTLETVTFSVIFDERFYLFFYRSMV